MRDNDSKFPWFKFLESVTNLCIFFLQYPSICWHFLAGCHLHPTALARLLGAGGHPAAPRCGGHPAPRHRFLDAEELADSGGSCCRGNSGGPAVEADIELVGRKTPRCFLVQSLDQAMFDFHIFEMIYASGSGNLVTTNRSPQVRIQRVARARMASVNVEV